MSNVVPSGNTPVECHRREDSIWSATGTNVEIKRRELRFSMHHKFIVVSPAQFSSLYVPSVTPKRNGRFSNILKNVPVAHGKELQMYDPLVEALNDAGICPKFKFAITAARGDPSDTSNEAVDIGLYPEAEVPQASMGPSGKILSPHSDWSHVELCIECKTDAAKLDPFDEMKADNEPNTEDRKAVLGQVLSYVEFILKRQQRTCVFMVLILGNFCRLARFDRAGAVVTEKFDYKTNGDHLIEFLWCYARCRPAQRGHDPSASRIKPSSTLGKKMQTRALKDRDLSKDGDYVRRMFEESLDPEWSWWKLRVDGEHGKRSFLVGKPNFQAPGIAGRGTRGYVALDANNIDGPFYYLKDAWRVVSENVDKEGEILRFLNKEGVQYVPTLECHGDIVSPQHTQTNKLWDSINKDKLNLVSPFKQHKHYRIVVKEVGQQMSAFKNSQQLIFVLWCCIYAHYLAYEAGVIHRDISAGNVLLYYDPQNGEWVGLLNDWELSKRLDSKNPTGRQLDRTGTWQFMSASALDDPGKQIVVEDELESFFHVLVFFCIRYLHHNCDTVADFMHSYFDDYRTITSGGQGCGSFKLLCMTDGCISLSRTGSDTPKREGPVAQVLTFSWPPSPDRPNEAPAAHQPLNTIFSTVLSWLRSYYALQKSPTAGNANQDPTTQKPKAPGPAAKAKFRFADEEKGDPRNVNLALLPQTELSPEQLRAIRANDETLARNLHSHAAFLALLKRALNLDDEWPEGDTKDDQLPKKGYKHGADLPSADLLKQPHGSMHGNPPPAGSAQKRTSKQIEQPATREQSKRPKTPPRRSTRRTQSKG